jgi:hypothetical protein
VRRCPRMSAASDTPDERQSEVIIRGLHQRSSQRSSSEVITYLRARCAQTCDRVHLQSTCRVRSYRRRGGQRGT